MKGTTVINFLHNETYKPGALFDDVMNMKGLRNDTQLANALGLGAPTICKMRKKHTQITADLLIRMHDVTGRTLDDLRTVAGIPIGIQKKQKAARLMVELKGDGDA